ncbi:MAG: CsbD family protein [Dehalococcoidia bacterium]
MEWDEIQANWSVLKGHLRERWGDLSEDDAVRIDGQREQLVGTLQRKYGTPREEAERQADVWAESARLHPPR